MKNSFLNGMTPEYFLKHYWNKKPCLFIGAVPEARTLGTSKDFLEMSYRQDFETRMVVESGGDYPWQAKLGPFKKSDYKKNALWTLICHNLELCNEDFQKLKKNVDFISDWHFDDIMVTLSSKGASVGAHIDDYSVFIIQGKGRRRWLLEENPDHGYQPDLDIRLLTHFNPEIEWILEPGDMLYLPPNVAHHGISLDESISYSIGFKSVRYNQLIVNYAMELMNSLDGKSFCDRKTKMPSDPFLVPEKVSDSMFEDVIKLLSDRKKFDECLLNFLSRPKNEALPETEMKDTEILKKLKGARLKRDSWVKFVSRKASKDKYEVSINQKLYCVKANEYEILRDYFELSPLQQFKICPEHLKNTTLLKIFVENFKAGVFFSE